MTEAMLRSRYGTMAANATLARNIVAPVAGMVNPSSELHRRCILVRCLPSCTDPWDVCDLVYFLGPIEAIAVSGELRMAVVVFETAVSELITAETLRRSGGFIELVPPLHFGPPLLLAQPIHIQFALHPRRRLPSNFIAVIVDTLASRGTTLSPHQLRILEDEHRRLLHHAGGRRI